MITIQKFMVNDLRVYIKKNRGRGTKFQWLPNGTKYTVQLLEGNNVINTKVVRSHSLKAYIDVCEEFNVPVERLD